MYGPYYDDLPQIVRSTGVAPFWRALAILGMIGILGTGFIALILAIALINRPPSQAAARGGPKPPPAWVGPGQNIQDPAGGAGDPEADEDANPGNLPFPVVQQIDPNTLPIPGEPPLPKAGPTPRQRFLELARDLVWKGDINDYSVMMLGVSPDGRFMSYADKSGLKAGIIGNRSSIELVDADGNHAVPRGMQGGMGGPMQGPGVKRTWRPVGTPSWSSDGRLYFAATDGKLREYDATRRELHVLACAGDVPAADPVNPGKLLFVRARPEVKTEPPDRPGLGDLTEVVRGDLQVRAQPEVHVAASRTNWTQLVVSPDGKRLALVASQPEARKHYVTKNQVYVMDLGGGEPKPISPPTTQIGTVAWLPDGQGLIYSRGHETLPADFWEEANPWIYPSLDLFHYDLQTKKETRLSRGGGFQCAGVGAKGTIYYRCDWTQPGDHYARLLQVDLEAAQQFAARQPEAGTRDVKAWTALIEQTYRDAQVDADGDKGKLTPELLAKLSDAYGRAYRDQFKTAAPACLRDLDRQRWEVNRLLFPVRERKRLQVLLAAVEGEYLRTHHSAEWHWAPRPPAPGDRTQEDFTNDNPFVFVVNVLPPAGGSFAGSEDEDEEIASGHGQLTGQVRQAAGRKLTLTNDWAAGKAAAEALVDPDLEKGTVLLKQRKNADEVLTELVRKYPKNPFLALHVARLLLEHHRRDAAANLLSEEWELSILDCQKHNLLGVARLDDAPRTAIKEFQKALGYNPYYGPALLNLAQAFLAVEDYASAEKCLRRYVKHFPADVHAADARRRLANLHAQRNGKP
jgi:hypothetical protein